MGKERLAQMTDKPSFATHRRGALALGLAGAAGFGCSRGGQAQPVAQAQGAGQCLTLTAQSTEGPFYFDPKLVRADITEGRPGVPIRMRLQVIDAESCQPLARARVDVWHADAVGYYSGYPGQSDTGIVDTSGKTFMRGTQVADAEGRVQFLSVFPGWYRGRTAHVHFKVLLEDRSLATGQLFLPDALAEYIYVNVPEYRRGRQRDTVNLTDSIAREAGRTAMADVREEEGYYAVSLTIAVSRAARAAQERGGPPLGERGPGGPGPSGLSLSGENRVRAIVPGKRPGS